jgi:thioredoxin-dependent peroxiredoxin
LTIHEQKDYVVVKRRVMMKTLKMGDKAPDFVLEDQNGRNVRLSDFSGKKLFLYFFPKANTSG